MNKTIELKDYKKMKNRIRSIRLHINYLLDIVENNPTVVWELIERWKIQIKELQSKINRTAICNGEQLQ